jgi:hypothetical protein
MSLANALPVIGRQPLWHICRGRLRSRDAGLRLRRSLKVQAQDDQECRPQRGYNRSFHAHFRVAFRLFHPSETPIRYICAQNTGPGGFPEAEGPGASPAPGHQGRFGGPLSGNFRLREDRLPKAFPRAEE